MAFNSPIDFLEVFGQFVLNESLQLKRRPHSFMKSHYSEPHNTDLMRCLKRKITHLRFMDFSSNMFLFCNKAINTEDLG